MKKFWVRCAGLVAVAACASVAMLAGSLDALRVRTEDRNRDGRPDAWRQYDQAGRLTKLALDSNFDGRSDIAEYYDAQGTLVRRESDRNFNGQVDLVEEFDPITHDHERSVVDLDYDGRADLLVLFRDGRPVFSKQAPRAAAGSPSAFAGYDSASRSQLVASGAADLLAPLSDPFQSDLTLRGVVPASNGKGSVGLSTAGGLPLPRAQATGPITAPTPLASGDQTPHSSALLTARAPRGPPLS